MTNEVTKSVCVLMIMLLGFPTVVWAPQRREDQKHSRWVWQAHVSYTEKGGFGKSKAELKEWSESASANYALIVFERSEEGFTWKDATVRYSDSGHHELYDEGAKYREERWSVSDSLSAKSLEEHYEQIERDFKRDKLTRGFGLGGLILQKKGKKVFVLEVPSIGVSAFHKDGLTIWERGKGTRREDLLTNIGGGVVGDQPVEESEKEREMRKLRGEAAVKPQMEDFAERQRAQVEKILKGLPKEAPKTKPGQKELTPEMKAYMEKMMKQPMSGEEVDKEIEAIQESEDALVVASLQQAGATELGNRNTISGSRQWGPTKNEQDRYKGGELSIIHTLTWSFSLGMGK